MGANTNSDQTNRSRRLAKIARLLVITGLALIVVWLGVKTILIVSEIRSLAAREEEAAALLESGVLEVEPEQLQQFVNESRADIRDLNAAIRPFDKVFPALTWIPGIGGSLATIPELLTIADAGSEAAVYATNGLMPALILMQDAETNDESNIPQLLQLIDDAQPDLAKAAELTEHAVSARKRIGDVDNLVEPIQGLVEQLDQYLPPLQNSLELSQVVPTLMGMEGSRTYLILAQNEDELRPTGGFISGAGLLIVDGGQIQSIKFDDAQLIDDWRNKPYETPPKPFNEFMGMDIFLFRDANFWPDFPASAEQAKILYTYGQNIPLDGVIALDQSFIQMLLEATGPLNVQELSMVVNADNVVEQMRLEWGPDPDPGERDENWVSQRKAFMGPLANAFKEKLVSDLLKVDPVSLGLALLTGLEEKHLQIYLLDPRAAAILGRSGWDGSMTTATGHDFLMVVDTNMGFNKVNSVVEKQIDYRITLGDEGSGRGHLSIPYNHASSSQDKQCDHGTSYEIDTQYDDLFDDCYWNYLRVYIPVDSKLIDSSQHAITSENLMSGLDWPGLPRFIVDEKSSAAVVDNFFLLAPGRQLTASFTYDLPGIVTELPNGNQLYQLSVDKQAGTDKDPLRIIVEIPPGARLVKASPEPSNVNGQKITFEDQLDTDFALQVEYK